MEERSKLGLSVDFSDDWLEEIDMKKSPCTSQTPKIRRFDRDKRLAGPSTTRTDQEMKSQHGSSTKEQRNIIARYQTNADT